MPGSAPVTREGKSSAARVEERPRGKTERKKPTPKKNTSTPVAMIRPRRLLRDSLDFFWGSLSPGDWIVVRASSCMFSVSTTFTTVQYESAHHPFAPGFHWWQPARSHDPLLRIESR